MSAEQVAARVDAYCERHGVRPSAAGVPPFPAGRRETPQHREWLALYRAVRRLQARVAHGPSPDGGDAGNACGLCSRPLPATNGVRLRLDRPRREVPVHGSCAELLRAARMAGREAVEATLRLLWPPREG